MKFQYLKLCTLLNWYIYIYYPRPGHVSFELASVIIHTVVRKKGGSFQPTTGENHNNENTWFPCLEQGLEVPSYSLHTHPAQLFWPHSTRLYWVFKCGKKYSGFRLRTLLPIIHQLAKTIIMKTLDSLLQSPYT